MLKPEPIASPASPDWARRWVRNVVTFFDATRNKEGKRPTKNPQKAFIYFDSDASEPLAGGGGGSSNLPVPTMKLAISRPLSDVSSRLQPFPSERTANQEEYFLPG